MKYFLSCIACFFLLFSFSQDLIPEFEQLADSEKDEKVKALIVESRSLPAFEDRIERIKEIAGFCRAKGDKATEALAISHLYITHAEVGKFDEANEISNLIEASYFEDLLPKHQLILNLYRAQPLMSQGRLDEAIELAQNTLAICEANDLPKNNVYGLLSTIYTALGKYTEALEMDRDNLTDILQNHPDTENALGQVYYSISRDFTNLDELDSANYYGIKSLDHWDHPVSLIQLGDINTRLGEYDSARSYFIQAESVITSSPAWKHQETTLYIFLSQLEINEKNWEAGLRYSENALSIARQENDLEVSQKAYENVIRSLLREDGYYLDTLLAQDTVLRNRVVMAQTIEMDKKYKTFEKEKEILELNNDIQKQEIETLRLRNYLLFAGVSVVVLIALLYLWYRIRRIKTEKEIDRLKKQALQLQMNPHFFFNSLNSIHNFVGNNETEEAQKYLVNFSKLMRLSLENSQENFISIKKEAEFLKNFLILERLRTKNFDFEIQVPEELEEFKIPTFLIQPLVENSLLHGFSPIDYRGRLLIKIERINESILITVSDNGIGREKSIELKQGKETRESFGMEILKKRIAIYSGKNNSFSIGNGIADSENPGTKITFALPLFS